MTQLGSIGQHSGIETARSTSASAGPNRFSEMTSEDFVRVIFTELTNQDPLQPNDTSALLEQLNSIRSIEADLALEGKLEALVLENQLSSAGNLIGKFVGGLTEDAQRVAGRVVSVLRRDDEVVIELESGWQINSDQLEMIVDEEELLREQGQPPASAAPPATSA